MLGPETPDTQPLVPRIKRTQEGCIDINDKKNCSILSSSKRLKLVNEPENTNGKEASEGTSSKFEWLDPSLIRDGNGRRPADPLYDRRTLYIPPDALKKMSASQKQYWSVKCQYMDVIIFFKVVSAFVTIIVFNIGTHYPLFWIMLCDFFVKCHYRLNLPQFFFFKYLG